MTTGELEKRQHAICRALAMIRYLINKGRIGDNWKLGGLIDEALSPHINLDKYIDNEGNLSTPMEKENVRSETLKDATKIICEKCRNNEPITIIRDQGYYHDNKYCPASKIHDVRDKESKQ